MLLLFLIDSLLLLLAFVVDAGVFLFLPPIRIIVFPGLFNFVFIIGPFSAILFFLWVPEDGGGDVFDTVDEEDVVLTTEIFSL